MTGATRRLATFGLLFAGFVAALPAALFAQPVDAGASYVKAVFTQMSVPVEGRFSKFAATVRFDPSKPADAYARIVIDTGSFDLGAGAEDYVAETRQPEWFDVARYPQAVFEAHGAKPLGGGRFEVAGRLQIKGRTLELRAPFTLSEQGGRRVFEGELPVSRLAFDIGAGEWKDTSVLADTVRVRFRIVTARE